MQLDDTGRRDRRPREPHQAGPPSRWTSHAAFSVNLDKEPSLPGATDNGVSVSELPLPRAQPRDPHEPEEQSKAGIRRHIDLVIQTLFDH